MKYLGLWYGGSSYALPDPDRDGEIFTSVKQAGARLQSLIDNDDRRTPCVDAETAEMHLYAGGAYHEDGPDRVLTIGPKGGIRG
jgi:hypothetical protein